MIDHLNILFRYCFAGVSQLWYYITSYMQVKPAVDMKIWNASFCPDSLWVSDSAEPFIYELKKGTSRKSKNIRGKLSQSGSERQQELKSRR